jgi:hypothetical protein
MSVLICHPTYGGCGHVGNGGDWGTVPLVSRSDDPSDLGDDWLVCPACSDDHAIGIARDNFQNVFQDVDDPKIWRNASALLAEEIGICLLKMPVG